MIMLWLVLVVIALVFIIVSKWLFARALFSTKVLQWAKHKKDVVRAEALWVWRIALVVTVVIAIGEYMKAGNPLLRTGFVLSTHLGLAAVILGLWTWLAAMDARKQYFWFFQVLAPKETLPPYSTNGIYGIVRNPRELGLLLVLEGLALAFGLQFTQVFIVLLLVATMYRTSSRDRVLLEKYGKEYIDYLRTNKKLIPFLY